MNEDYVNALVDVVKTFLSFSEEWLEDDVIDNVTYDSITHNKKKFVETIEKKQD